VNRNLYFEIINTIKNNKEYEIEYKSSDGYIGMENKNGVVNIIINKYGENFWGNIDVNIYSKEMILPLEDLSKLYYKYY